MDKKYFISKEYFIGKESSPYSNDIYIFKLSGDLKDYDIKVNGYIVSENREGYIIDFTKLEQYPIKAIKTRDKESNKKYPRVNLTYEILDSSYISLESFKEIQEPFTLYYAILWENKGREKTSSLFIGREKGKYIIKDYSILGVDYQGDHLASNKNIKPIKVLQAIKSKIDLERWIDKLSKAKTLIEDIYTIESLIPKDYELDRIISPEAKNELRESYKTHRAIIDKLKAQAIEILDMLTEIKGLIKIDKDYCLKLEEDMI